MKKKKFPYSQYSKKNKTKIRNTECTPAEPEFAKSSLADFFSKQMLNVLEEAVETAEQESAKKAVAMLEETVETEPQSVEHTKGTDEAVILPDTDTFEEGEPHAGDSCDEEPGSAPDRGYTQDDSTEDDEEKIRQEIELAWNNYDANDESDDVKLSDIDWEDDLVDNENGDTVKPHISSARDNRLLREDAPEKDYKKHTYTVISTVAYLIGVKEDFFVKPTCAPDYEVYKKLNKDKRARIVRNLCCIRTCIERKFSLIKQKMKSEFRGLNNMPEYIPTEYFNRLMDDGITNFIRGNKDLNQYLIDLNMMISDRINNCRDLFPIWLNWQYVRPLFIMPDGFTVAGLKRAADVFIQNKKLYPYGVYLNWNPVDVGNLFANDKKFCGLLYKWNGDVFADESKVSDAGSSVKRDINDFIEASYKTELIVDCENSDPYKLCATLRVLNNESSNKIVRITLIDDEHTSSAWGLLESYTNIPILHIEVERLLDRKSQVDGAVQRQAIRSFYKDSIDSFIIVASDSDYWSMIKDVKTIEGANFLVMCERSKFSSEMKKKLNDWDISYCYIDDFYSGDSHSIMINALVKQIRTYIDAAVRLNVNDMMQDAFRVTRVPMTEAEQKQFYDRYIRNMSLEISPEGDVLIKLNK